MTDIVERLRDWADTIEAHDEILLVRRHLSQLAEAADEIERLRGALHQAESYMKDRMELHDRHR